MWFEILHPGGISAKALVPGPSPAGVLIPRAWAMLAARVCWEHSPRGAHTRGTGTPVPAPLNWGLECGLSIRRFNCAPGHSQVPRLPHPHPHPQRAAPASQVPPQKTLVHGAASKLTCASQKKSVLDFGMSRSQSKAMSLCPHLPEEEMGAWREWLEGCPSADFVGRGRGLCSHPALRSQHSSLEGPGCTVGSEPLGIWGQCGGGGSGFALL